MRKLGVLAASALLLFGATACSSYNDHRGKGDAPAGKGDDSPAAITNMPDDFHNAATKCIKGFAPWAFLNTTSDDAIIFQAPEACGGKAVPGPVVARPPAVYVGGN